jgi:hypothetical protein
MNQFLSARIALCEEGLRRFPFDDGLITENRRRALAESYYELGEADKARKHSTGSGWMPIRAGAGVGSAGRTVTDSRAPNDSSACAGVNFTMTRW